MERSEIIDILTRMNALPADVESIDPTEVTFDAYRLSEDPIVSNRIAVEAIQLLPRDRKFEVVLPANKESELFAYALAMAAWARFATLDHESGEGLAHGYTINNGEQVLIVDTLVDDSTTYEDIVDIVADNKGKLAGALSIATIGEVSPLAKNYFSLLPFGDQ